MFPEVTGTWKGRMPGLDSRQLNAGSEPHLYNKTGRDKQNIQEKRLKNKTVPYPVLSY